MVPCPRPKVASRCARSCARDPLRFRRMLHLHADTGLCRRRSDRPIKPTAAVPANPFEAADWRAAEPALRAADARAIFRPALDLVQRRHRPARPVPRGGRAVQARGRGLPGVSGQHRASPKGPATAKRRYCRALAARRGPTRSFSRTSRPGRDSEIPCGPGSASPNKAGINGRVSGGAGTSWVHHARSVSSSRPGQESQRRRNQIGLPQAGQEISSGPEQRAEGEGPLCGNRLGL